MTTLTKRGSTSPFAELVDWLEAGWPSAREWRLGTQMVRIEDRLEDDRYVLRAEIPGIDPEKDVEITVQDGILTISGERKETVSEKGRSEFHYGSFLRRVPLPAGAREDALTATYEDGIIEITVPVQPTQPAARTVPIARTESD